MIDFGFDKLALIGAVALVVIGPERLPRVARTVGHLMGKAQRYVADVKAEVNRSIELEELKKMKTQFEDAARNVEQSVSSEVQQASSEMNQAWSALSELRQKSQTSTDGYEELITKYRGSDADPFIRLTYAARLYEAGSREEVEKARAQLEAVLQEHKGNGFLVERVTQQLARIKLELEDPRAKLAAKPAADPADVNTATPIDLGDDEHGPDDGHGH